jgi:DNA-binding SARP family transcriptional activator
MLDISPDPLPICRVRLLGTFQMDWRLPSLHPTAWQGRTSARSLFLLLLCAPHRCATRSKLAGLLWPESEEEKARESLRSALKVLYKVLTTTDGQCLLESQPNGNLLTLKSQEQLWVDVDALLSLVEQASTAITPQEALPLWQAAEALLGGEWLPADRDHEWSRAPWLTTRRRQVVAARRQVVRHLSQQYLRLERDRKGSSSGVKPLERLTNAVSRLGKPLEHEPYHGELHHTFATSR